MKKALLSVSIGLVVFISSSITSLAAVCPNPNAPGGVHDFSSHKVVGGTTNDLGYHDYLYGYDQYHNPIYHSCHMTQRVDYCYYVCYYCGTENPSSAHTHLYPVQHSASH